MYTYISKIIPIIFKMKIISIIHIYKKNYMRKYIYIRRVHEFTCYDAK